MQCIAQLCITMQKHAEAWGLLCGAESETKLPLSLWQFGW